jgi:diguanylate cyclase (GGDEF)-like protein
MFGTLRRAVCALEDRLTIRQQVGLTMAILCIAIVSAVTTGTYSLASRQAKELVGQEMVRISKTLSDRLDRVLQARLSQVKNLVVLDIVRNNVATKAPSVSAHLLRMQASFPDYEWIGIATPDGVLRYDTKGLSGISVADQSWFEKGKIHAAAGDDGKPFWPVKKSGPRDRLVYFSAPIYDGDANLIGVLGAYLNWNWADDRRTNMLSATDDIVVVASDGEVLFGPKAGQMPYDPAQLAKMQESKNGSFLDKARPAPMLSGYAIEDGFRDLKSFGWTVIAQRPVEIAFAPAEQLAWMLFGVGFAVTVGGIAMGILLINRAARPILALTAAADLIGRGDSRITMLPRQRGSIEIIRLSGALRSLLIRLGFAESETTAVKRQAAEQASKFESDIGKLRELAGTDPLTGVLNRRSFMISASEAMLDFKRYGHKVSALVVDIDDFKKINDRYGHKAGDDVIRAVGQTLRRLVRASDKVARFGGEEFVVMLREATEAETEMLADRMREAVGDCAVSSNDADIRITVSVGGAAIEEHDRDFEDLLQRADQALYRAKGGGKNCVRMAPHTKALRTVA